MAKVTRDIKSFFADEPGLETVEYAIIAGLIALVVIATIGALSLQIQAAYETFRATRRHVGSNQRDGRGGCCAFALLPPPPISA